MVDLKFQGAVVGAVVEEGSAPVHSVGSGSVLTVKAAYGCLWKSLTLPLLHSHRGQLLPRNVDQAVMGVTSLTADDCDAVVSVVHNLRGVDLEARWKSCWWV